MTDFFVMGWFEAYHSDTFQVDRMTHNTSGYMNGIDELIERTPLDVVLSHYGLPLTTPGSTKYRMKCVFNEACSDSKYGNLAVKLDSAKRMYCHVCETKGNLLTLIHGIRSMGGLGNSKAVWVNQGFYV